LLGSMCAWPDTAPLKRKSEVSVGWMSSGVTPSTVRKLGSPWWSRVAVVVQQHGDHVGAHHLRHHVKRRLPSGDRLAIDIGGAEL
jgi:hypothetical protein